jgi:antirestriction protein ArdC
LREIGGAGGKQLIPQSMKNETTYQLVTDRIIARLNAGTIPWLHFARAPLSRPKNLVTKKAYRGINVFLLSGTKFGSPWWLTYKQASGLGGNVIKGEKSEMVVFWKILSVEDKDPDKLKRIPMLRHYRVFNAEQCEGIEYSKEPEQDHRDAEPVESAEAIVNAMPSPPKIVIDRVPRAYYSPAEDVVHVTERSACVSNAAYYDILFHELVHATGHKSRLNRMDGEPWHSRGSKYYATEELIAEMGAAMLCAEAGMFQEILENSAAYIAGWLSKIGSDNQLVVHAAGKSQKAADWILNRQYAEPAVEIEVPVVADHVMTAGTSSGRLYGQM